MPAANCRQNVSKTEGTNDYSLVFYICTRLRPVTDFIHGTTKNELGGAQPILAFIGVEGI